MPRTGLLLFRALALPTLAAALLLPACAREGDPATIGQVALLERMEDADAPLVLDVRTPEEYESGHVPGAVNLPYDQLAGRLGELDAPEDREIVVYCERGGRAGRAESTLREAGYTAVRHLEGDMSGWRAAGLPCVGC